MAPIDYDPRQDDIVLSITHTCEVRVTREQIEKFRRENPGITGAGDMHFNHNIAQLIALSESRNMIQGIDPNVRRKVELVNTSFFNPNLIVGSSMLDELRKLTAFFERASDGR